MDKPNTGFPETAAEKEYVEAASNYKADLRKLFESASEYTPGAPSDMLSNLSALLGQRKKESADAFDKLTSEVLSEIDEQELVRREKPLGKKGGGSANKG